MPEGHSVARWSDTLQVIVGEEVTSITVPPRWRERAESIIGARVTRVHAHGKHLVMHFSSGWVIHSHAMQYGSWQIGPHGQELRKEARFARLRLTTPNTEAVFFHGPVMEVLTEAELSEHERYTTLGPDLLKPDFDISAAIKGIRAQGAREIGDTVLDQRVVAGIGNIYKSEGLFLATINPLRPSSSLRKKELTWFFEELIPLMQLGRTKYGMTITLPEDLRFETWIWNWVYRRSGQPCFVCATPIRMFRQGDFQRTTFYCPHCQPFEV